MEQIYDFIKNLEKGFSNEMVNDTIKYQRKYGFEIGKNNSTWNNEADAFKHAYMQAVLSLRSNVKISEILGDWHENIGNKKGQDPRESNMDLWNNQQGRLIADEIRAESLGKWNSIPSEKQKDIIAEKVMQKMRTGQLITSPDDSRQFQRLESKPIQNLNIPTRGVGYNYNTYKILRQMELPEQNTSGFSGYLNPLTGNNRIYTREDIDSLSGDEFTNFEREIMSQLNSIGIPTNGDMQREMMTSGDVVYVNPYSRADGTKVKGYYRSR